MGILEKNIEAHIKLGQGFKRLGDAIGDALKEKLGESCVICRRHGLIHIHNYHYYNINFEKLKEKDTASLKDKYLVCPFCAKFTEIELGKIEILKLEELPLQINHNNLFVRHAVIERLRG